MTTLVHRREVCQHRDLVYHASWVSQDLTRCYQLMECDDPALLDEWMSRWSDVMSFEVVPVVTSAEAVAMVNPRL